MKEDKKKKISVINFRKEPRIDHYWFISPHEGVSQAHVQTARNRYPAGVTSQHTRGYANA